MSDALRQDSELAAASWLRDPLEADHQDELVAWHGRFAETAHQSVALRPDRGGDQHIVLAVNIRHRLHRQAWPHLHRR